MNNLNIKDLDHLGIVAGIIDGNDSKGNGKMGIELR
jgi:hypothetical protein